MPKKLEGCREFKNAISILFVVKILSQIFNFFLSILPLNYPHLLDCSGLSYFLARLETQHSEAETGDYEFEGSLGYIARPCPQM